SASASKNLLALSSHAAFIQTAISLSSSPVQPTTNTPFSSSIAPLKRNVLLCGTLSSCFECNTTETS
ncbi:MAG: hypothetical protein ABIZ56_06675, partial [Chthoniobacteraceae bacterium]